ncbi:MAG: T9SS type A sorting domain-containing protein, partial [Bacteroidales bacterium]|nr:T9SS type A sorting domain-containing protein [Bacteroidales bacterium]
GSYDGQTYLLETIDLFANTCDTDIGSYLQEITFNVSSDTNSINKSFNVNGGSTSTIYDYSITHSTLCCDFFPLESIMQRKNEIQEIINSKKQEYKLKSTPKPDSNKPEIKVLEKSFKCTNAEGVCKYTIYNSMGIIIDQGITNNNAEIMLPKLISGTYIIKLIDENYKETSKKIIINEIY